MLRWRDGQGERSKWVDSRFLWRGLRSRMVGGKVVRCGWLGSAIFGFVLLWREGVREALGVTKRGLRPQPVLTLPEVC